MKTRSARGAVALLAAVTLLASQPLGAAGKDNLDFSGKWNGAHSKLLRLVIPAWEEPMQPDMGWERQPKGTVKEHAKDRPGTVIISSGFTWDRLIVYENRLEKGDENDLPKGKEVLMEIPVKGGVSGIAVGDYNSDHNQDFAFADYHSNKVETYFGDGKGHFSKGATIPVGRGPVEIISGDFNGDGETDIATANVRSQTMTVASGSGDGKFRPSTTYRMPQDLAARELYAVSTGTCADYSALQSALGSAHMEANNERRLQKYVNQSEKAYDRGNGRRALDRMESFVSYLDRMSDSKLSNAAEQNLRTLAESLISEILDGCAMSVTLTATPGGIASGGSSLLTWTSAGATSAEIDNGIGTVTTNGSTPVNPDHTTTYSIMVTGEGGTKTASAVVTVGAVSDIIYVDANRGSDASGNGTPDNPYRTMTKGCAVAVGAAPMSAQNASATKTVLAAGGLYSADTGEVFPITVPAGTILRGAGSSRTVIMGSGAYTSPGLGAINLAVRLGNASEIGSLKVVSTGGGTGVLVENVVATVTDCSITGCERDGIDVGGSGELSLLNSTVSDNVGQGVWAANTSRLNLSGNTFSGNGLAGVFVTSTASNLIQAQQFLNDAVQSVLTGTGLTVQNNTFTDTTGSPGAIASLLSGTTITNNTITGDFGYGVLSFFGDTATISSNVIDGPTAGIFTIYYAAPTISSNSITNCFRGVYSYFLDFSTITGNTITECGRGMRLSNYSYATVTGNSISGNSQGIQMSTYVYATVTGNTLTNNQNGITEFYYSDPAVTGNTVTGGETGILVSLYTAGDFSSNTITGNSNFGVEVYLAYPDFDPPGLGLNTIMNLGAGADANISNCGPFGVDAQNNTWDNVVPTAATPCTATGVDVAETIGGSVTY
ncbi:MAG: right-handed parallel beta-helix repeat-containing protein [Acidobacteria bacterium]|nr:right-handed parallel beta-helix repeat-containing protein [Acidobacteriota bacterium]